MVNLWLIVLSQSRLLCRTGPPFLCSFQGCYIMLLLCLALFFLFSYFLGFCDHFLMILWKHLLPWLPAYMCVAFTRDDHIIHFASDLLSVMWLLLFAALYFLQGKMPK